MTLTMSKSIFNALEDFKTSFDLARCTAPNENTQTSSQSTSTDSKIKPPPKIEVPEILDKYVDTLSRTGVTGQPWKYVKPVFLYKLNEVMRWYNDKQSFDDIPEMPNCKKETFRDVYSGILTAADAFKQAPFTIQRLCELICRPELHYKRIDKFLRALEKNAMVVTTVDELGRKLSGKEEELQFHSDKNSQLQQTDKLLSLFDWINNTIKPPKHQNSINMAPESTTVNKSSTESPDSQPSTSKTQTMDTPKSQSTENTSSANGSTQSHQDMDTDNITSTTKSADPVDNVTKPKSSKRSLTEDNDDDSDDQAASVDTPTTKRAKVDPETTAEVTETDNTDTGDQTAEEVKSESVTADTDATQGSDSIEESTDDCVTDPFTDDNQVDASLSVTSAESAALPSDAAALPSDAAPHADTLKAEDSGTPAPNTDCDTSTPDSHTVEKPSETETKTDQLSETQTKMDQQNEEGKGNAAEATPLDSCEAKADVTKE